MRIEMRAGGIMGTLNVAMYQATFNSFSNSSAKVKDDFDRVVSSFYSLNGGVGNLQNAVSLIQQRVRQESQKQENIRTTRQETNKFLEETVSCDKRVASIVSQNDDKFYEVNPHLKPTLLTEISLCEDIYKLLQDNQNAVTATAKSAQDISDYNGSIVNIIMELFEKILEIFKNIPNHGLFDEDNRGYYGGDQGSPQNAGLKEKKELYKIIRRNNPEVNYSDRELNNYLRKVNDEGCGYVSVINTIFYYFLDKPDEFYEKFGYPMRDENGQLNYNMLLIDLYSSMDNRRTDGTIDIMHDYDPQDDGSDSRYNYRNDSTGIGTNEIERAYYAQEFLRQHGVDVVAETNVNVTVENYSQIVSEGKQVAIAYFYGNIYDENGRAHFINGGHSMYVTGVTADGRFIVSSWGNVYYIDPNEKNSNPNYRYRFETYQYR